MMFWHLFAATLVARGIRDVRVLGVQGWVVLAVGKVCHENAKDRARQDILPVVSIIHRTGDGDKGSAPEWDK